MKIKLLLVLFLSLFLTVSANAAQEKSVVRVAISNQSFSNYNHKSTKISSSDTISIIDMSQNTSIEGIEPLKVIEITINNFLYNIYVDGKLKYENLQGPLLLSSNRELEILELNRKGKPAKYKGMLELRNAKNLDAFNIINVIDIQNYLRGVVPNEMPVSFGLEALKAQSVAARNYVNNAKISPNYDVVDSTASQVYYGANSYREISDDAVNSTKGIYALYNEEPISALYFSTSPGITDDWDDVFAKSPSMMGSHPYLKARYDGNIKPLKSEKEVEEFYSKKDFGYDVRSPKFRWQVEFAREELEDILNTTLLQQSKAGLVKPLFDGSNRLEGLKEIKPIKRTQSGKITELEIISSSGNYRVESQLGIRRVFKKNNSMLPSANFFVRPSKKEEVNKKEEESGLVKIFDFSFEEKYPCSFVFIGGGYGHGVGMSQFGAYYLAQNGKKYPEILNHYYTDIKISTIPKTLAYSDYNMPSKTEFYYEPDIYKKVYLFINNQRGVSEFPFMINDLEFSDTKEIADKRVVKIDIAQYLKKGLNTLEFAPLKRENKGKHIIYRVEFQ